MTTVGVFSARADGARLEGMLVELQHSDFIYAQTAQDQTIYAFKHVLTQEVTYQSLLSNRRERLHETVALEHEFRDPHQHGELGAIRRSGDSAIGACGGGGQPSRRDAPGRDAAG